VVDSTQVILVLVAALEVIITGILGWALLSIVAQGRESSKQQAEIDSLRSQLDSARQTQADWKDEIRQDMAKLYEKIDHLGREIAQALLSRRAGDKN
jgi:predicted PurR-regulated permease PerM